MRGCIDPGVRSEAYKFWRARCLLVDGISEALNAFLYEGRSGVRKGKYLQIAQVSCSISHDQRATAFHLVTTNCAGDGAEHMTKCVRR
jgi:hypothetical protein